MGPKSTLRLMRTVGPSLASLAQSSWSLLAMALVIVEVLVAAGVEVLLVAAVAAVILPNF